MALVAVGFGLGAAAIGLTRSGRAPRRARPAPAGKTPAGISPALLGSTPQRRFYAGHNPANAVTIKDLRAMAHRRLPDFALDYLEGGSEEEASLAHNLAALADWRFTHRSLVDVSQPDTSTILFGRPLAMPVAVAPTGLNGVFWPHADLLLAEAAAAAQVPFAQSTMSNDDMRRVARVPGLRYWWQLYVFGPRDVRGALIDRAREVGCEALVVTTDAQIYGNREWDKRNRAGSNSLSLGAMFDTLGHPRWLASRLMHGMPRFENVIEFVPKAQHGLFRSAHWVRSQMDRALTWDMVARIRDRWPRKLIVKGLLDIGDVVRAQQIGADAVALSNHGGRQLDWAAAPLDLLPEARRAVGRAVLYGVAAAGRAGAGRALAILREEIERDLGLLGVPAVADLDRSLLRRPEPHHRLHE